MSQETKTEKQTSSVSIEDSNIDDPYIFLYELYSPVEKKYYHQQKDKLEAEVVSLKNQVSNLKFKHDLKNQYVTKGELFQLKYQVIDSFYTQNIHSYTDMIHSYNQTCIENSELQKKIIFYEKEIEKQYELHNSLIEENEQLKSLFDFTDFTIFPYPRLTNAQYQDFTKINLSEIDNESDNNSYSIDSFVSDKKYKTQHDFFIEKIHEQICWEENLLNGLWDEISKFDMLLDTYNESQKRNAANTILSAQQTMNKKNEISLQANKLSINDLRKLCEDSEKVVFELEHQNEELRKKKVKNNLDYQNKKAHLKMLRQASLECYKKEISEMKNKAKHLRRLINSKADEYDFNCESLLNVFNEFDQKINGRREEIKDILNGKTEDKADSKNHDNVSDEEEEEEEIVQVFFNDPSQTVLLNELEKKRNELEYDIKMMKKQLKNMVLSANSRYDNLLSRIQYLQNKEEKYQNKITFELSKMQKLPRNINYKYMDNIDASMLKLSRLLENT